MSGIIWLKYWVTSVILCVFVRFIFVYNKKVGYYVVIDWITLEKLSAYIDHLTTIIQRNMYLPVRAELSSFNYKLIIVN